MRRLLAILAVVAVGVTAPVDARKAPPAKPASGKHKPGKHKPHKNKQHKNKPHRKPARKPAVTKPAGGTPVVKTATVADPGIPATEPVVTPQSPVPAVTGPAALSRVLGVSAREFGLTLSRTTLGAGAVTVEVRNVGEDPHDLRIDTLGAARVAVWDEIPAEAPPVTKTVTLAAGSYRLYCTLPTHAELGMDKQITVVAG